MHSLPGLHSPGLPLQAVDKVVRWGELESEEEESEDEDEEDEDEEVGVAMAGGVVGSVVVSNAA